MPKVTVTLAGDREVQMSLAPSGAIAGELGTQPIVPVGLLATVLSCQIKWSSDGLRVLHPQLGELPVKVGDGCPMIPYDMAMKLIKQIEDKSQRSLKLDNFSEVAWLKRMVEDHPVFQRVPEELKQRLVEIPAESLLPLGNRRQRQLTQHITTIAQFHFSCSSHFLLLSLQ